MKKSEILEKIKHEILSAPAHDKGVAINQLPAQYIALTVSMLLAEGQQDFLKHLSIKSLIIVTRHFFSMSISNDNVEQKEQFITITKLPRFPKVWEKIQHDNPTFMFRYLPHKLLRATLRKRLVSITPSISYGKMICVVNEGSRAEIVLHIGNLEKESIKAYEMDVRVMYRAIAPVQKSGWIIQLAKELPSDYKLDLFYGSHMTDAEIKKLFCIWASEGGHISDARQNPRSLALGFLDYTDQMISSETKKDRYVEEAVEAGTESFAKNMKFFAEKMGATRRLADILDGFNDFAHAGEDLVVQGLATAIIRDLFKMKRCPWMKDCLSANQATALSTKGSVGASDAVRILRTSENVFPKNAEKIQNLSLAEKMQIAVQV